MRILNSLNKSNRQVIMAESSYNWTTLQHNDTQTNMLKQTQTYTNKR